MNNKNCVFTICATNYVGLAKALEESVHEYSKSVDFIIIVADEPSTDIQKKFTPNVLIAKDILHYTSEKWYEMAFKYNLTEFCTSIKPYSFNYFFEHGYEKVIYLDPDILTFSSMNVVFDYLDNYSAVVTPHIVIPDESNAFENNDLNLLHSGVYNFGFIALKNTSQCKKIINWWGNRLQDYCFDDRTKDLYTDQKWGEFLTCYLGNDILVTKNKGLNLAPWNFHERRVINRNNELFVCSRNEEPQKEEKLIFVHYSGYNYQLLLSGEVFQKNIKTLKKYDDIQPLIEKYTNKLRAADISTFIGERYTYNYFNNEDLYISDELRLLYRGFIESKNNIGENPFDNKGYIYKCSKRLGLLASKKQIKYEFDETHASSARLQNIANYFFKMLFSIIGHKRYYLLIRFMRKYAKIENHSFLLMSKDHVYRYR